MIDFGNDDGCADADDMSERGATTECDNGIDDDGDGFVDFHDLDGDGVVATSDLIAFLGTYGQVSDC